MYIFCESPSGRNIYYYEQSVHVFENSALRVPLCGSTSELHLLQKSTLDGYRFLDGMTVIWRLYILDLFEEADISPSFLQLIEEDMEAIRQARFTAVIRFTYTNTRVRSCVINYKMVFMVSNPEMIQYNVPVNVSILGIILPRIGT